MGILPKRQRVNYHQLEVHVLRQNRPVHGWMVEDPVDDLGRSPRKLEGEFRTSPDQPAGRPILFFVEYYSDEPPIAVPEDTFAGQALYATSRHKMGH